MSELPWGLLFLVAVVLGSIARSSYASASPAWIKRSIDRLMLAGAATYLVGIGLALMNRTTEITRTADAVQITHSMRPPFVINAVCAAVALAVIVVSLVGLGHVLAGSWRARDGVIVRSREIAVAVGSRSRRLIAGLLMMAGGWALASFVGVPLQVTLGTGQPALYSQLASVVALGLVIMGAVQAAESIWSSFKRPK